MKYLGAITNDYDLVTKKYVDDAAKVIQTLTSGTAIGSVGGTTLYAPTGGSGTITSVKTTAGAHSTINVSSGAANFNVPTAASHVGAVADCTISLYNGKGGNPGACKFCTVDYSACDSNNGVLVKITMMAGHGNGTSYNHYQDAIISVGYTGTVSVNIFRYYAASVTYESTTHYYGDIFYTIDTTNKVVTFYDLMGQYSYLNQAPYKKMNGSSKGTVTQFNGTAVHYSSGTKTYANIFWMDGRTKANLATTLAGYGITDAHIQNGTITLGSNTLTPLTSYTETDPTVPSWAKASTKPSYTASEVGALASSGDTTYSGADNVLALQSAAATNSPILRFQRGTLTDNYNDWQIQDRGGFLYFDERGQNSTTWTNRMYIDTSGGVYATSFYGSGANLTGVSDIATYSTTDITAGSTSLATGKLYLVYE